MVEKLTGRNLHWVAYERARTELETTKTKLAELDTRIETLRTQSAPKVGEVEKTVGSGWAHAANLLGKKLIELGAKLAGDHVTVTELERDPTAQKTAARVETREQVESWAAALSKLSEERDAVAEQLEAHAKAMLKAYALAIDFDLGVKLESGLRALDAAVGEVVQFAGSIRSQFFGAVQSFTENPAEPAVAKALAQVPGFDAGRLFALPDPKTGREWVCLVAGLDYSAIQERTHLARDFDKTLKKMRVPVRHEHQTAKDVKRQITKLFGLPEKAIAFDVKTEVDRRIALGVDRFTNAAAFAKKLAEVGLPANATAKEIANRDKPDLGALVAEMYSAPEKFAPIADRLDAIKKSRIKALEAHPSAPAAGSLLVDSERMHGKGGHSANAVGTALAFLTDPAVSAAIGKFDAQRVCDAVGWLNLGDLGTPVSVIAAKRKMTDEEFVAYVKPRPERAAEAFRKFALGDEATATLIATHRGRDRSLEAILVDLMDQLAALGAKPFFQTDGKPDPAKVFGAIQQNNAKAGVAQPILDAIEDGLERGLLAEGLTNARLVDQYVR